MSKLLPILMSNSGLDELTLRRIIETAPLRYKHFEILKRSGGMRVISQPARELKALQRTLSSALLSNLPVHHAATAYKKGVSIKHNAERHSKNGPILKYDFKDFFPSIVSNDWEAYCKKTGALELDEDIRISSLIFFSRSKWGRVLRLAIGAPSSPQLSNVLMYDFDEALTNLVSQDGVTYTRYADDLTFSAERIGRLKNVEKNIRTTIKQISFPNLTVKKEKTVLATKKFRRTITGIVLPNGGGLSLGHSRKRLIRASIHHFSQGKLSRKEVAKLAGMIAFCRYVEPNFVQKLSQKYGEETFNALVKFNNLPRSEATD